MPSASTVIVIGHAGLTDTALLALCAGVLAAPAPAPPIPSDPIPDCDDPAPPPCFVSITKNGTTTLEQNDVLDTGVEVIGGQTFVIEGARY
jgi:hypothetical protein